jgi:hypothetical protein
VALRAEGLAISQQAISLISHPLIPAKAGIQFFQNTGSRFRGDERTRYIARTVRSPARQRRSSSRPDENVSTTGVVGRPAALSRSPIQ